VRFTVANATHALIESISDVQEDVVDSMWFVQHAHGPFQGGLDHAPAAARVAAYEAALASRRRRE